MREGSLEAPTRHPLDWKNPEFWDQAKAEKELELIFDICHGCRRCVSLCTSFPTLFDLVDASPSMELDGVITGVENFGMFITGVTLPAEGFVHISALTDDYYRYDRAGHVIAGFRSGNSYRLGDAVRVAVAAVNVDTRELDFAHHRQLFLTEQGYSYSIVDGAELLDQPAA